LNALLAFSRLVDRATDRLGHTIYWLVLAAVLISAANAVVRKAFNYSSNSFLEIQWYLFSVIFLFLAGYTLKNNEHVRIDIITGRFSARTRAAIDIFGTLFFLLPMAILIMRLSWPVFVDAYRPQRGLDQRRRAHHLAGAAPGAGRLLLTHRPGALRAHQAHRVPEGTRSRSRREDRREDRRRTARRGNPAFARRSRRRD
jgi:TRAP-type C4-dicarboxylate transport system permease small subunit